MEREIWFKRKRYGWGWYPSSWQGWLVILVWLGLFIAGELEFFSRLDENPAPEIFVYFFLYTLMLVAALIGICYRHGEPPRWQWGEPKDEK